MWNNVDSYNKENMTKKGLSMGYRIFIATAITLSIISSCSSVISDKRLCYDSECSEPIALANTLSKYIANDPDILSFDANKDVTVFSKSAGRRTDLWGVEIAGKRGYAPTSFLREKKVLHKVLKFEVPTEKFIPTASETDSQNHENEISANSVDILSNINTIDTEDKPIIAESFENSLSSADRQVSPSFEIIDGTTINFLQKEESKQDESYATQIIQSVAPATEQPILTVHPNLVTTEVLSSGDLTPEMEVLPSGITQELLSESISQRSVIEELPAESLSLVDKPQPTITHESSTPSEDGESMINVEPEASTLPVTEEEPIKTSKPEENIQIQKLGDFEESKASNTEKIDSNNSKVIPTDGDVQVTDDETTATSLKEQESVIEVPQVTQQDEATEESQVIQQDRIIEEIPQVMQQKFVEEVSQVMQQEIVEEISSVTQHEIVDDIPPVIQREIVDETSPVTQQEAVEEDPQVMHEDELEKPENEEAENNIVETNLLVNAFDRVASLFDVLSTTETPETPQVAGESLQTSNKDQDNFMESVAQHNNKEETSPESPSNDDVIQEDLHDDKVEYTEKIVNIEVSNNESNNNRAHAPENLDGNTGEEVLTQGQPGIYQQDESAGSSPNVIVDQSSNFSEFPTHRNLLNVGNGALHETHKAEIPIDDPRIPLHDPDEVIHRNIVDTSTTTSEEVSATLKEEQKDDKLSVVDVEHVILPAEVYHVDNSCDNEESTEKCFESSFDEEDTAMIDAFISGQNYWETLSYLALTAFTTLLFSLGYYYIENTRRDGQLIAKINKLEKELLIASKECTVLDETLKSTKNKLNSIEDETFGSNETVASLKVDLETTCNAKRELEDQVAALEKDLESATEAGLELERMLREILASKSTENPLAKSVEDLQARLTAQQSANESLNNTLHLKTQEHEFDKAENEALSSELAVTTQKCEQLEVEISRINEELKLVKDGKNTIVQSLSQQIEQLEKQTKDISAEKITLRKQLKGREMEIKDLLDVVKQANINNLDFDKLSDVSQIKADASQLMEERDELKIKLSELEGAHHLLEEHMKIINEEVVSLSEQCKLAEKEKNDAVTRLQVLSKFFKEKEEERQKEEAVWLQQQGEVSTTVDRLHTMQNEIQSYKQQIETLKREILDQEREYKVQMTSLESKAHEQWVLARQSERRLEESKAEAGQLRNRLTLIEKNLSDTESDIKVHRLETNGETATSPQLFIGAEASSSPIMFTGSSSIPPPYLPYGPPLPPFLPPHLHASPSMPIGYDVGQRPPPLGGRLSSPPPMPSSAPPPHHSVHHPSAGGRYDRSDSSPPSPPLSPSMIPPYVHYRSHPPPPLPFPNDRIHPPPPVPLLPPAHLSSPSWGEDKLSSSRNNGSFRPFHREQRARDYKGSLESSVESLDKTHHSGKV